MYNIAAVNIIGIFSFKWHSFGIIGISENHDNKLFKACSLEQKIKLSKWNMTTLKLELKRDSFWSNKESDSSFVRLFTTSNPPFAYNLNNVDRVQPKCGWWYQVIEFLRKSEIDYQAKS